VWPDLNGNISYLLTICIDDRAHVLNNEPTFDRLVSFLLDSPTRYHWFGRRFVIMPDHIHLIAHTGQGAIQLGQWIKALKAVVGGLQRCESPAAASGDAAYNTTRSAPVGRVTSRGGGDLPHEFTRIRRTWRWQAGFHDHKFRTPESETRKWEYICLNPVRRGLVERPEEWPFGGEIFFDDACGPRLVHGTPSLLDTGILLEQTSPRPGPKM
jgi:REP element-mobilizing transposase RayT